MADLGLSSGDTLIYGYACSSGDIDSLSIEKVVQVIVN